MTINKILLSEANLFTFNQTSDIQDVVLGCAGTKRLVLGIQLVDTGSYVSGAKLTLLGSFDLNTPAGQFIVHPPSLAGSAVLSGGPNLIALYPGDSSVVVEDPPSWLTLSFSATTFGTSPGQSSVLCAASWR